MHAEIFDPRQCELGEGPLWHPEREELFWFDIVNHRLLSQAIGVARSWQFDECVSAAGILDAEHLLIASETGLWRYELAGQKKELITPLEAENPITRSNDGRVDPKGGFWIGTMGKSAEEKAGAIYRLYRGELRKLYDHQTIPNSICFAPDGSEAYFTSTPTRQIMRQSLDAAGWPKGEPRVFVDLRPEALNPDGSVVDAAGFLWNAQWGSGRVARYDLDGQFVEAITLDGQHSSCPAFGGRGLETLFVTTAYEGIENPDANQGCVYAAKTEIKGQREHRVIL